MSIPPRSDAERRPALGFSDIGVEVLDRLPPAEIDALPFGVVGMVADGTVVVYNITESNMAGIARESVMGTHFMSEIGQCMNNFMVAQRFEDETELDEELDYVLTLRMRPTPVRLRLLKTLTIARHYILIRR
ncbi:MAG: phosphonate transporter [Janthinobacterium lividum]